MIRLIIFLLALSGCAARATPPQSPIVALPVIQTETVVRVERVPVYDAPAKYTCPADPRLPMLPTQKQLGAYIATLLDTADQCRANLEALSPKGAP